MQRPMRGGGERRVLLPVGGVTSLGVAAPPTREQTNPSPPPSSPWRPCEMVLTGFREGPGRSSVVSTSSSSLSHPPSRGCVRGDQRSRLRLACREQALHPSRRQHHGSTKASIPSRCNHHTPVEPLRICRPHHRLAATISQTPSISRPAPWSSTIAPLCCCTTGLRAIS